MFEVEEVEEMRKSTRNKRDLMREFTAFEQEKRGKKIEEDEKEK